MATHRIPLLAGSMPDATSGSYWKPSTIDDANDRFRHMVLALKDTGTKIGISGVFAVPKNWVNTNGSKIVVRWKTPATTGDLVLDLEYKAIAAGESMDPSADDEALTVTDAAAGTTLFANDAEFGLDESKLAVDDLVLWKLSRDGVDAADTLAAECLLEEVWFEYLDT